MTTNAFVKNYQQTVGSSWYKRLAVAAVLLLISYGLASWAIDNGNLLLYIITVILVYLGIANIVKATALMFSKNGR